MIKAMLTLHKKSGTSGEEFRSYWRGPHAEIAAKIPGLRGYTQNHAQDEAEGDPACSGIAELWFDSPEAMGEAFATPEGEAALADIPNFADPEKLSTVVVEEVKVI